MPMITEWFEVDADELFYTPDLARAVLDACDANDYAKIEALLGDDPHMLPSYGRIVGHKASFDKTTGKPDVRLKIERGPFFKQKEIEIPEWISHWCDDSWSNDALAFASIQYQAWALVLGVDYQRKAWRESSTGVRYWLARLPVDEHGNYDIGDVGDFFGGNSAVLYQGEDSEECRKRCKEAEAELGEQPEYALHHVAERIRTIARDIECAVTATTPESNCGTCVNCDVWEALIKLAKEIES